MGPTYRIRYVTAVQPLTSDLEWRRLHAYCTRAQRFLSCSANELLEPVGSVSAWSIAEHLFHVALSNELGLRNVRALLEGTNRRIKSFEELSELGQGVLKSGRYPRGKAEAPRMVRPPARVDLGILKELIEANLRDLAPLEPELARIQSEQRCIPHQGLGDLAPVEWLRFMRAHSWHHALIVRDIEAARR